MCKYSKLVLKTDGLERILLLGLLHLFFLSYWLSKNEKKKKEKEIQIDQTKELNVIFWWNLFVQFAVIAGFPTALKRQSHASLGLQLLLTLSVMSDRDGLQRAAFRTIMKVWYKWDKSLHHHISLSQAEMQVVILNDTFYEEQYSNKWKSDNSKPSLSKKTLVEQYAIQI